ncbi:hypothetical protein [Marinimicrobium sp. ABcell2]|uniref:hypothetical protein n=1 Tax=Marinimicrobium sp. ABcell2 TaxID=3069751 RepID=UPI0027B1FAC6|nr:hypothetical protein [Marinimicrobium sp. ABcell2]MDQ2077786.1 hypothetical protein [Marinimicrobium sp. ABcell2]
MDDTQLAKAAQIAEQLHERWHDLINAISTTEANDGSKFDTTSPVPELNISIDDLNVYVKVLYARVSELTKISTKSLLLAPPMTIRRLIDSIDKSATAVGELVELVRKPMRTLDSDTFQGTLHNPQQASRQRPINFVEKFVVVARHLDEAFTRSSQLQEVSGSKAQSVDLDALISGIQSAENHSREYLKSVEIHEASIQESLDRAENSSKKTQGFEEELSKLYQSCIEVRKHFTDEKESLSEAAQEIRSTCSTARGLEQEVSSFQEKFEEFRSNIEAHQKSLRTGQAEQERILKEISLIEEQITDKNTQASSMLANATVAGLAASFGATRDKLNIELTEARRVFYISIVALFLLSIPMILYIIPGVTFGGSVYESESNGFGSIVGQLVARASILLPGILFVAFASRRHASLFRLREHYVYKYNMAASVEGFKQQAPEMSGAIAGTTFYELLTRNPADAMDGGKHGKNVDSREDGSLPMKIKEALAGRKASEE